MSMRRCTPYIAPILLLLAGCGDAPAPKNPPLNLPIKGETPKADTPKEESKSSATALTHLPALGEKLVVPEPTIDLTQKAPDTYIGSNKAPDGQPMKVHTVLVTRKSDTVFQGLVRYEPRQVPITQVPGISDLRDYFAAGGQVLPGMLLLLEQETEVLLDNLNTPMRSITSSKLFLNPLNGHAVAYDIANTSGGQPQRFVGHLTRRGIHVDVFRGSEYVDQHDLPFVSRDTFIPYEIEFIHQWYTQNPEERGKPVKFSIFMPEVMSYVLLSAKPLGDEIIPIKDTNYECARYEVTTASMQALDGLTAKQIMWFDKRTGLLQRREDFETSLAPGDAPVSERGNVEDLKRLSRLTVRPPQLPEKAFPFALDRDQAYTIRTRDKDLGRLSVRYSKNPQGGYTATANVNMEGEGVAVSRTELAITQLDERFMPLDYQANGEEKSDGSTKYKVTAKMAGGRVEMVTDREYVPPPPEAAPANTEKKEPVEEWTDPIRRVPLSDAEARAEAAAQVKPRSVNQSISRALSPGTFFYDFNRIEHLAAFAHRLPIPTVPPDLRENDAPPLAFQKVALFAVRQNRAGVIQFEVKPEPKPRMTERQKKRFAAQKSASEPQLFVATCSSPILPCRMLLTAEGRLLELTLQFGSNEVTYSLDDPIMQKRLERAKKQELQVGPVLIRPPWY